MKATKVIVVCCLLVIYNIKIYSQSYIAPKYGINGIVNYSKSDGLDFEGNSGHQYGIELGTSLIKFIGLRVELMYVNQAFSQSAERIAVQGSGETSIFTESLQISNGSLQFNGAIQLKLGSGFEISIGPQISSLLNSEAEGAWIYDQDSSVMVDYDYINDGPAEGGYWNYSAKDGNYFEEYSLGINLGVGIRLFKGLYVDVRSNYALTELFNDFYVESTRQATRDFDVIINASYRIPIFNKKMEDVEGKEEELRGTFLGI